MFMNRKERQNKFKIGIEYLQQTGFNLIIQSSVGKLVFKPGSFIENKEKETLSIPYTLMRSDGVTYNLSEKLRKRYQVSTEVDLKRLTRICAILITDFNGPDSDDTPKVLFTNLRTFMREKSNHTGWEIILALKTFDNLLGFRKQGMFVEYSNLAGILNTHFNLWKELEPFSTYIQELD